jgi:hypothetical protein
MFDFSDAAVPVRSEIAEAFRRDWQRLGAPGTWWSGQERVAIAEATRRVRLGESPVSDLPRAGLEAIEVLSARPAQTSKGWVEHVVSDLGEERYVEIIGVVSRTTAVDTFTRLVGSDLEPLPEPVDGEPSRLPAEGVDRGKTWVPAGRFPIPPTVLALVPDEVVAQNDLSDLLYMTGEEMADPDWSRGGLHRTQAELVASATSFVNECFF